MIQSIRRNFNMPTAFTNTIAKTINQELRRQVTAFRFGQRSVLPELGRHLKKGKKTHIFQNVIGNTAKGRNKKKWRLNKCVTSSHNVSKYGAHSVEMHRFYCHVDLFSNSEFSDYEISTLSKGEFFTKIKIQGLQIGQNCRF